MMPFPLGKRGLAAWPAIVMLLLLAACSVKPLPPPLQEHASQFNATGRKAYLRGDHEAAVRAFELALVAAQSGDTADGIALSRLNLARVEQARGNEAAARRELDALLDPSAVPPIPPRWRAEAAARKALLLIDSGKDASGLLDEAHAWCGSECPTVPMIANLRARVAADAGDHDRALSLAADALVAAQKTGSAAEEANALRTAGRARLAKGETAVAATTFAQALDADKREGRPERIYADLMLLGETALRLGQQPQASDFFRRAEQVAKAEGMNEQVAMARKRADESR